MAGSATQKVEVSGLYYYLKSTSFALFAMSVKIAGELALLKQLNLQLFKQLKACVEKPQKMAPQRPLNLMSTSFWYGDFLFKFTSSLL